jgi:methylated-DNA-[protein]-cysteine S-methyltransferase
VHVDGIPLRQKVSHPPTEQSSYLHHPTVPCHRVISTNGYVAGYKGDWEKAPSGINQSMKLKLLKEEGLEFTDEGILIVPKGKEVMFDGPWKVPK